MRYFMVDTLGDDQDKSLALITEAPEGLGVHDYCMARGKRIGEHYPSDAKVYLQAKRPGIKLSSLLGNTFSYLIVSTAMKDAIVACSGPEIELLPFTLYNHKKRVHSRDYWIVNPIGSIDCVDKNASEIEYFDDEDDGVRKVVGVDKYVFDRERAALARGVFRVPESLNAYFIDLPLARALQQGGFTNVLLEEIQVTG